MDLYVDMDSIMVIELDNKKSSYIPWDTGEPEALMPGASFSWCVTP